MHGYGVAAQVLEPGAESTDLGLRSEQYPSCMMREQIATQCSAQESPRGTERDHYWRRVSIRRDKDPWQHPATERLVQLLETLA
jgi:hypothetical protein